MGKADEFIKRGLIVGLAVTTIGGATLPLNTAYAATNNNAIVSMASSIVINAETEPASLEGIDTTASTKIPSKLIEGDEDTGTPTTTLDGTPISGVDTIMYMEYANNEEKYLGREIATGYDVYEVTSGSDRGLWDYYKTFINGDGSLEVRREYSTIGNYRYYTYIEAKKSGAQLGYTDTVTGKHVGSTGHITSIKDDVRDWEYKAPEYIITELELPLNYVNPWYTSENDADPAKNVKTYYYLGTVIYNDTTTKSTATGYDSLSDAEKQNYNDIKYYYNQKVKTSSAYNAKAEIVKKGIEFESADLPFIYQLLTGEKFDWQYWYNEGIEGAKDYASYKISAGYSYKFSHGVKSNYAKAVTITPSTSGIVQVYKVVKNGEARVYVKGLKKGTTTLTIKTTLNDGKTVTYKTKVTVKAAGSPIKYKTDVNPLSYAAYALKQDGGNWLGYLSKFGEFYTKNTDGVFQIIPHPTLNDPVVADYGDLFVTTKYIQVDRSNYLKDLVKGCGAFDMLKAGKSEYEVLKHVYQTIMDTWESNIDNNYLPHQGEGGWHYSLQHFVEGAVNACADEAAISAGIAEVLGLKYYSYLRAGVHVENRVVVDGKQYQASATNFVERDENEPVTLALPELSYSYKSIADVSLSNLISGKYTINVTSTRKGPSAGVYYKISDKYEAGRFDYGALFENEIPDGSDIREGSAKINDSFGVLEADKGDVRLLTLRAGVDPAWDNKEQNTVTFRYAVPYMERAYFTLKKGSTKQLQLVNSDWSEWTIKTSDSKIATVNSTGKVTMKGTGTATITLTHKTIKGLYIKVLVSTSTIKEYTVETKAGTFYSKNDSIYTNGTNNIIAGNYMRIHD